MDNVNPRLVFKFEVSLLNLYDDRICDINISTNEMKNMEITKIGHNIFKLTTHYLQQTPSRVVNSIDDLFKIFNDQTIYYIQFNNNDVEEFNAVTLYNCDEECQDKRNRKVKRSMREETEINKNIKKTKVDTDFLPLFNTLKLAFGKKKKPSKSLNKINIDIKYLLKLR